MKETSIAQSSIVNQLNNDKQILREALETYKEIHPERLSGNYLNHLLKLTNRLFQAEIESAASDTEAYTALYKD